MEFVTSDQHFNHANIIKYCNRPFANVDMMNKQLIKLWNDTVSNRDIVYVLGDFAFKGNAGFFLSKLNGKKLMIKGNHDKSGIDNISYSYDGIPILFSHRPTNWDGWNIHGHVHNSLPFFNDITKKVNISVEVTGYKPISLDYVLKRIKFCDKVGF